MELPIRQVRKKRGWTQQYVANKVGVTQSMLQNIETGKRKPSYNVLVKLEDLFQMSHRELFGAATPDKTKEPDSSPAKKSTALQ